MLLTVDPAWPAFKVHQVEVHLAAVGVATDLTFTRDSGLGAEFDTAFTPIAMTGVLSAVWHPDPPVIFGPNDTFVVSYPDATSSGWGVQVYIEGLFE